MSANVHHNSSWFKWKRSQAEEKLRFYNSILHIQSDFESFRVYIFVYYLLLLYNSLLYLITEP